MRVKFLKLTVCLFILNLIFINTFTYFLFISFDYQQLHYQIGSFFFFILAIALLFAVNDVLISPLNLTFFAYSIYFGIGLFILSINQKNYYPLFIFSLSMFCLSFGAFFSKVIFTQMNLRDQIEELRMKNIEGFIPSNVTLFILFLLSISFYALVFIKMGGIPLLSPSLRDTKGIAFYKDFANIFGIVSILGIYLKFQFVNKSSLKKIFSIFLFIFTVTNIFLLLSRHVVLELVLMLFLLHYVLHRVKKKYFLLGGKLAILILVGGQIFRSFAYQQGSFSFNLIEYFYITYKRVILIGARTLYYIFDSFPHQYPFFLGSTYIKRLITLYEPGKIPNLGYWLFEKVMGSSGGYDPISIIGEFYINFGIIGTILGMFLLGLLIQVFTRYFLRNKTWYRLIIFAIVSTLFIRTFAYSLMGFIASILLAIFAFLLLEILDKGLSPKDTSIRSVALKCER